MSFATQNRRTDAPMHKDTHRGVEPRSKRIPGTFRTPPDQIRMKKRKWLEIRKTLRSADFRIVYKPQQVTLRSQDAQHM